MSSDHMNNKNSGASTDEMIIRNLQFCFRYLKHHTEGRGSQRRVLSILRKHGTMTQRDILDKLGIRASSLSELLSKLEAREFIVKSKNELDKRNYDVSITDFGLETLEEMQSQYISSMADLLSGLEEDEKRQLSNLLEKLHNQWRHEVHEPHHKHR